MDTFRFYRINRLFFDSSFHVLKKKNHSPRLRSTYHENKKVCGTFVTLLVERGSGSNVNDGKESRQNS